MPIDKEHRCIYECNKALNVNVLIVIFVNTILKKEVACKQCYASGMALVGI